MKQDLIRESLAGEYNTNNTYWSYRPFDPNHKIKSRIRRPLQVLSACPRDDSQKKTYIWDVYETLWTIKLIRVCQTTSKVRQPSFLEAYSNLKRPKKYFVVGRSGTEKIAAPNPDKNKSQPLKCASSSAKMSLRLRANNAARIIRELDSKKAYEHDKITNKTAK